MAGHRTTTFAAGSHVPGANLNTIQDRAHILDRATATDAGAPTDTQGSDWLVYQSPDAGIATATVTTLDASDRDWRERLVHVHVRCVTTAARRWGRADEHVGNDPVSSNNRSALGVTGPGAVGAASATVANGTAPVVTTNSCPIPLDVRVDGTIWIFADPSTGALKLYNDTTTPLHLDLLVMATGRSTDPAAPPPDLVPTLTEILWLTPSVAASRPASPGALIAIHRATDTGAITLWDSAAWRSLGIVSPLTTRGDVWVHDGSGDVRLALGTRGYVFRAGALDPAWGVVAASATSLPTASADYAGAVYWRSDLGAHFICTFGGLAAEWAWRVASIHDGAVAEDTTPGDAWTTIASTQIAEDSVALLDIEVAGIRSDHAAGLAAKGYASFLNDGGTLSELEAISLSVGDPTRLQLITSGPDVEVQVKGVAAEDWTWRVKITRRLEVEP